MRNLFFILCFFPLSLFAQRGGGGFMIIEPPIDRVRPMPRPVENGMFALQMTTLKMEATINNTASSTTVDQVFYNPTQNQLEGYYYFPIPKDGAIAKFSMWINGKETQGEVLDAAKARQIYEDIVRRSKDPALLEFYGQGLFRVRVFPIQPRSEQRIKMTYTQTLTRESGMVEYVFPLHDKNDATKSLKEFSFKVSIAATDKIKTVYCPTHKTDIHRKDENNATLGFEGNNVSTEKDLKVYYSTDNGKVGASLMNYTDADGGYFMLNLSPGLASGEATIAKDITFVADVSGSMSDEKMAQLKKALLFCMGHLNENDRFNIVRFSTEANGLFEKNASANSANRAKAKAFIEDFSAIGGTNIDEALQVALDSRNDGEPNRPYFIVFMTDGKPTIGETDEETLLQKVSQKNNGNTRIFTFGIGVDLNTHLLDRLTEMTKAYRTYVLPDEDIEVKISDFYTKVASPILTDVEVKFDKNVLISEVYPKKAGDMFKGSTLTIAGRYKGTGVVNVTVTGTVNGQKQAFNYSLDFVKENKNHPYIASVWATRAVAHLLDEVRLRGESKEVKDEIVRLSKKYGIITPYTSYLILEDEAVTVRNPSRPMPMENQLLSPRVMKDENIRTTNAGVAKKSKEASAAPSVVMSQQIEAMKNSDRAEMQVANEKSFAQAYDNNLTGQQNLAANIRNVQGRAFYQNDNKWVDANVSVAKNQQTVRRINYQSSDYFAFLNKNPTSAELLSLGNNIRFVWNEEIVEIYE